MSDEPITGCACGQDHPSMPREYDPDLDVEYDLVCRTHKRHLPCRPCMREERAPIRDAIRDHIVNHWTHTLELIGGEGADFDRFVDSLARAVQLHGGCVCYRADGVTDPKCPTCIREDRIRAATLRHWVTEGTFATQFFGGPTKDMVTQWALTDADKYDRGKR